MGDTTAEEEAANKLATSEEDPGKSHEAPRILITEASLITEDNGQGQQEVPDDIEEEEEIPNSPAVSEYFTAPSSRRHTSQGSLSGMISPSFDTTAEEMALFEKFGEDYDEVVGAMSHQEKIELREFIHKKCNAVKIFLYKHT